MQAFLTLDAPMLLATKTFFVKKNELKHQQPAILILMTCVSDQYKVDFSGEN